MIGRGDPRPTRISRERCEVMRALCAVPHEPMTRARWRPTDVYALVLFRSYIYIYIYIYVCVVCVYIYVALSPTSSVRFPILSLSLPPVPALRVARTCDNRAYHDTPRIARSRVEKGEISKGKSRVEKKRKSSLLSSARAHAVRRELARVSKRTSHRVSIGA